MRAQGSAERLECSEDAFGIRRGRPDEDIHVVRGANVAVQDHSPAAHQQEFCFGFAELDQ
jgi:hypothetical protein